MFNSCLDRYCPNPPPPPANGGISNWNEEMNNTTPYGFKVLIRYFDKFRHCLSKSLK